MRIQSTLFGLIRLFLVAGVPLVFAGFAATAGAQDTGLPVPRMVSLKAGEVNVRTGPELRHPIKWVYKRRNMPVEIVAEFEAWRKIRDYEGDEGWVHRAMLSSRRTGVVTAEETTMRSLAAETAPAVARLATGMVTMVELCKDVWCLVTVEEYEGWVKRDDLWGLYPRERIE